MKSCPAPCLTFHRKERVELMYLLDPSGLTGLEPAASALTGRCSDQLNYNPREIRDIAANWILFYSSVSGISEGQGVIPSHGRLANYLLGRAGFEPAQTYCQRIYSPSPLTARASTQEESILGLLVIHDQLPFVVPYPQGKSNPRCLLEREMS